MNEEIKPIPGGRGLLKAILQALLILALAAGFAQGILFPLIQGSLLESVQSWEVEYLNGGTIDLLADELNAVPPGERLTLLEERSRQFGFNISIGAPGELELDSEDRDRLRQHDVVGDPETYTAYKLLDNADQVLIFSDTKRPADHLVTEAQRRSMGTLAMLESILGGQPENDWARLIENSSSEFNYPVRLAAVSELKLTPEQLAAFHADRIVTVETEDSVTADYPAEFVYKKAGNSGLVLGPFSPPTLKRFYPVITGYYALFGLVVLLPLGLWLAPTWRSMNQLSDATTAFGQGNFAARATPGRGSKTNHLIEIFNQMAGKIQGLVESNKALVNAVSHELRTPISRIEFNIELARQSNDIAERNRQLDRIESSVDELKTMVTEMLQYARFDREKPNFRMESVDLGEWLTSEAENWQTTEDNATLRIDLDEVPARVTLERYYMSRAISNLVRNASRFAKSAIEVKAQTKDGMYEISVADDGPGVDYQERTRIFEPFVRHDQSRNRESGGTGLGLAIVKQIVAWHSGDVWVEDSPLGGAKFVVQWPQNRDE